MKANCFNSCTWLKILLAFSFHSLHMTTALATGSDSIKRVAVIGATGKLGRQAVQQLVSAGVACNVLLRSPTDNTGPPPGYLEDCQTSQQVGAYFSSLPLVRVVQGDVTNVDSLIELTRDCQACLGLWGATRRSKLSDLFRDYRRVEEDPSHAKQVNYQGVKNLIEACRQNPECQRIVRVTGKGEDPSGIFSILINTLGSMAKAWNYQGEMALREGNIPYTIVRPGVMGDDGPTGKVLQLADNGGDLKVAKVAYRDIASLCVKVLVYDNTKQSTLTAMTTSDETVGTDSWDPWLPGVKADSRQFPDDMLQQHYSVVKSTLRKLFGSLAGLTVLFVAVAYRSLLTCAI